MVQPPHKGELGEPQSLEAAVLTRLGYGAVLGKPIPRDAPGGESGVLAEDFLNAYPTDSPHRQETADMLEGFQDMESTDSDYPDAHELIMTYFETIFGPPPDPGA